MIGPQLVAFAFHVFDGHPERETFEIREEDGTVVGKLTVPSDTFSEMGKPNRVSLAVVAMPFVETGIAAQSE